MIYIQIYCSSLGSSHINYSSFDLKFCHPTLFSLKTSSDLQFELDYEDTFNQTEFCRMIFFMFDVKLLDISMELNDS